MRVQFLERRPPTPPLNLRILSELVHVGSLENDQARTRLLPLFDPFGVMYEGRPPKPFNHRNPIASTGEGGIEVARPHEGVPDKPVDMPKCRS